MKPNRKLVLVLHGESQVGVVVVLHLPRLFFHGQNPAHECDADADADAVSPAKTLGPLHRSVTSPWSLRTFSLGVSPCEPLRHSPAEDSQCPLWCPCKALSDVTLASP